MSKQQKHQNLLSCRGDKTEEVEVGDSADENNDGGRVLLWGAAVLHTENHVQRVVLHLHLSDASQPGLLHVKSSRMCSKVSAQKINAFDGDLIYKIMERFPRNRHFGGKL